MEHFYPLSHYTYCILHAVIKKEVIRTLIGCLFVLDSTYISFGMLFLTIYRVTQELPV
jgi:hypothetical protein